MKPVNLGDQLQILNLLPVAAVTASGNGTAIDMQAYDGEIAVIIDVSAPVAGTNPTMDLKLQDSDDNSTFTDVASFTQVTSTASAQKMSLNKDEQKRYIRIVKTIGGTASPQYLVSAKIAAILKYSA